MQDLTTILIKDNPEQFVKLDSYESNLNDVVYWDSINIFKFLLINNYSLMEENKNNILLNIIEEDKILFLDTCLSYNLFNSDYLEYFLTNNQNILNEECLKYFINNNILEYNFSDDYFLIEAADNQLIRPFIFLLDIYKIEYNILSYNTIEVLLDLDYNHGFISYLINNHPLNDKQISHILNYQIKEPILLEHIISTLISQNKDYLIDNDFLYFCIDNSFFDCAKLLVNLELDVSIYNNNFLNFAIENNSNETFYDIIKHNNFNAEELSSYHFVEIFNSKSFDFKDFKFLIDIYISNFDYYNLEEFIEFYDNGYLNEFSEIIFDTILNKKLEEFIYLYTLKETQYLLKNNKEIMNKILELSLISNEITDYLFIQNNQPIWFEKENRKIHITEIFKGNSESIELILNKRNDSIITEEALKNATKSENSNFISLFLKYKDVQKFSNLSFLLPIAADNSLNFDIFNIILDSNMVFINEDNYKIILENLIKSGNNNTFQRVINLEFMKNKSLNEFALIATNLSAINILKIILNDNRYQYTEYFELDPISVILNKNIRYYNWSSDAHFICLSFIIKHPKYKFKKEHVNLLKNIIQTEDYNLSIYFMKIINQHSDISFTDSLNQLFLLSFKNVNISSKLLSDLKYIDVNLISTELYDLFKIFHGKKDYNNFIIKLLKMINNINSYDKYNLFSKIHFFNFEQAKILFQDKKFRDFLIEKNNDLYNSFNKKIIKLNSESF